MCLRSVLFFTKKVNYLSNTGIYDVLAKPHCAAIIENYVGNSCKPFHDYADEVGQGLYANTLVMMWANINLNNRISKLEQLETWLDLHAKDHPPLLFELGLVRALLYVKKNISLQQQQQVLTDDDVVHICQHCVPCFTRADILSRLHCVYSGSANLSNYNGDLFVVALTRLVSLLEPFSCSISTFCSKISTAAVFSEQCAYLQSLSKDYSPKLTWIQDSQYPDIYSNKPINNQALSLSVAITRCRDTIEAKICSSTNKKFKPC